jgi:mercuric ion transport protein
MSSRWTLFCKARMGDESAMKRPALLNYMSLFTSLGTLLCCALPSLLVLLGLGATVASFLSAFPFVVVLSRHKLWIFLASGLLIAVSFISLYYIAPRLQARALRCDIGDPRCQTASRFSRVALWIGTGVYACGAFVAYALGPILERYWN